MTIGARLAQAMAVTASPAMPAARWAMVLAVAGAMTSASAPSASSTCAICWSASSAITSSTTGRWVSAEKVSGVTNAVAAGVMATSTIAPRSMSRRTSETAL